MHYTTGVDNVTKTLIKRVSISLLCLLMLSNMTPALANVNNTVQAEVTIKNPNHDNAIKIHIPFADVPKEHWAYGDIHAFREKNITQGLGNNQFGLGKTITRGEFTTFLARLMEWENLYPIKNNFKDVLPNHIFYPYVESAVNQGAITLDNELFRPDQEITREEMAQIIVGALGYNALAKQLNHLPQPFVDVEKNIGAITLAKEMGIVSGINEQNFAPTDKATREQAVAILMRMDKKLNIAINELHGFYAIDSYEQRHLLEEFDSISFGWSRLEYDVELGIVALNTTGKDNNAFKLPQNFSYPVNYALEKKIVTQLNIYASNATTVYDEVYQTNKGLVEYVITNSQVSEQVIQDIVKASIFTHQGDEGVSFDGVVIDFENIKGEKLRQSYNDFLRLLKEELAIYNKRLIVAIHPKTSSQEYFDGYDYATIGEIADKVILMAHDYQAVSLKEEEMNSGYTMTPLTPIKEIYYALKSITDPKTGINDLSKIWFQFSFGSIQWKLVDGKVVNKSPYKPTYEQIYQRLLKEDQTGNLTVVYVKSFENPKITYTNLEDGTKNIIWYEDARSIEAKLKLAKLYGLKGVSLWRFGNIPAYNELDDKYYLNVWQNILDDYQKNNEFKQE